MRVPDFLQFHKNLLRIPCPRKDPKPRENEVFQNHRIMTSFCAISRRSGSTNYAVLRSQALAQMWQSFTVFSSFPAI